MRADLEFVATVSSGGGGDDRVSFTIRGARSNLTLVEAEFTFAQWGEFIARPGIVRVSANVAGDRIAKVLGKLEVMEIGVVVPDDLRYGRETAAGRAFLVGELRNRGLDQLGWVGDASDLSNGHRGPVSNRRITLRRYVDEAGNPI